MEVAGMSGMTGGTTRRTNQNNLFVNPAKDKQAFIIVRSVLLRSCNQIKQKDKHMNEHEWLRVVTLKPIIIVQRRDAFSREYVDFSKKKSQSFSTPPVTSEEAL